MGRVAILGSCITRDIWRFRGAPAEALLYVSRTSFPALLSQPVAGFTPLESPPGGLKPAPHRAVVADLQKTALRALLAFRPTHIIFDFIDERFDLLAVDGAIITRSAELVQSGYLENAAFRGARRLPRDSEPADRLWTEAAERLAALIHETPLRDARLILHSARWASHSRQADGALAPLGDLTVLAGEPTTAEAQNRRLAGYEQHFEAVVPQLERVAAPDLRQAAHDHIWGLSPFHYVEAYYEEIARQLEALGIGLARG